MTNASEGNIGGQNVKGRDVDNVLVHQAGERLAAIDRIKGLGIVLVVWGHLATSATPGLPTWFYISVTTIYSFHMPLFMYLSGFTFVLSKSHDIFGKNPIMYVWRRANRLLVPCVAFGILIVLGKHLIQNDFQTLSFFDFTNSITEDILLIIRNGKANPALSLWYLIVLFMYSISVPVFYRFVPFPTISLCAVGLALWVFEFPEKYYIARIAHYLIFFAIGGLFSAQRDRILPVLFSYWLPAVIIFTFCCYLTLGSEWSLLISGLSSIIAIHGIFLQKFWARDKLFIYLGNNSMAIYLINTIAIGVAQIVYTRYLPYQGGWFLVYSPFAFLFGLLVPIAVRYILSADRRLQSLKKYID